MEADRRVWLLRFSWSWRSRDVGEREWDLSRAGREKLCFIVAEVIVVGVLVEEGEGRGGEGGKGYVKVYINKF